MTLGNFKHFNKTGIKTFYSNHSLPKQYSLPYAYLITECLWTYKRQLALPSIRYKLLCFYFKVLLLVKVPERNKNQGKAFRVKVAWVVKRPDVLGSPLCLTSHWLPPADGTFYEQLLCEHCFKTHNHQYRLKMQL